MIALLVGAHFRPPAKLLLESLSSGCGLILEPEPDNPYDEEAVKVLVKPDALDLDSINENELLNFGFEKSDLLAQESWHLGYLARAGNKALSKIDGAKPAGEILGLMAGSPNHNSSLLWGPNGEPLVRITEGESR